MLLGADGRLDDQGVEGVGDQGDGDIVLRESLVEGLVIADIEGNGSGILEAFAELLGALEGSAGWSLLAGFEYTPIDETELNAPTNSDLNISLAENLNCRLGDLIESISIILQRTTFSHAGHWMYSIPRGMRARYHTEARAQQEGLGTSDLVNHDDYGQLDINIKV